MYDDDNPDTRLLEIQARYKAAREHASKWRDEARECFDYYSGHQWSEDDKAILQKQLRPVITFNRAAILIDAVLGYETNNRMETRYIPRTMGDSKINEELTEAANYFRDLCDAEFEESDAFRDAMICGMGWTNDRLSDDANPEYDLVRERVDPFEMFWDPSVKKPNLADARYIFRQKYFSKEEVQAMLPDWSGEVVPLEEAWQDDPDPTSPHNADLRNSYHGNDTGASPKRDILVREYQCVHKETRYLVASSDGQTVTINADQFAEKEDDIKKAGLRHTTKTHTEYRRTFMVGGEIVTQGGKPDSVIYPHGFTYHCITGKRDRNRGFWFGIMTALIDPQNWSNKWLSQILHIINSNAKGGLLVEKTAIGDQAKFEGSWADPSGVTVVEDGAVSGQRLMPKPPAPYPTGIDKLLEYANTSFTDVSGVNQELLGMADREQPGVLEWQRKQSAVTLLAPLFDSLRRYRKMAGRTWLYLMTKHMSDGRMVRITQDEEDKNVPFGVPPGMDPMMAAQMMQQQPQAMKDWKSEDVSKYDVIVDQSSSAPNQKEATWAVLQPLLPAVGELMDADTWMLFLQYSPLPESLIEKLEELKKEKEQQPPPPDPEMMKAQAQIMLKEKELEIKEREAQMKLQYQERELQFKEKAAQVELQIKMAEAQMDFQIKEREAQLDYQTATMKANTDMQVQQALGQNKIAIAKQDMAIDRQRGEQELGQKKKLGDQQLVAAKQKAKMAAQKPKPEARA